MNIFDIFNTLLVFPIINILLFIYHVLSLLPIPYPLGFSIIVLTIIIRLILYPLTASQIKAAKKMQELTPHLSNLKEKHKNDAKTLQQETMKLYKEHGVNPAAGCLPILIQLPVIWGLYSVLNKVIHLGSATVIEINKIAYTDFLKITKVWDTNFFGLPLAQNPQHLMSTIGPIIILVPVLTGVFQFVQSKMLIPAVNKNLPVKQDGKKKEDDFATAFQSQSLYIFPVMIGFFSWSFPIGLSLYWNTFTIFGIIQQHRISGLGGLEGWLEKIWQRKIKS